MNNQYDKQKEQQKEKHVHFDAHIYEIPSKMGNIEPFEDFTKELFEEFNEKVKDLFDNENLKTHK